MFADDYDADNYESAQLTIKDLEKVEASILGDDKTAFVYDKSRNLLITPFHRSMSNFMGVFSFTYRGTLNYPGRQFPITVTDVYADDDMNMVFVNYAIDMLILKFDVQGTNQKQEGAYVGFLIDPLITLTDGKGFKDLDLKELVQRYSNNDLNSLAGIRDTFSDIQKRTQRYIV